MALGRRPGGSSVLAGLALWVTLALAIEARCAEPPLARALDFPFESGLVRAEQAPVIAWVREVGGARNVWVASGPGYAPRAVTRYTADDGRELTWLTFSPDADTATADFLTRELGPPSP